MYVYILYQYPLRASPNYCSDNLFRIKGVTVLLMWCGNQDPNHHVKDQNLER